MKEAQALVLEVLSSMGEDTASVYEDSNTDGGDTLPAFGSLGSDEVTSPSRVPFYVM